MQCQLLVHTLSSNVTRKVEQGKGLEGCLQEQACKLYSAIGESQIANFSE